MILNLLNPNWRKKEEIIGQTLKDSRLSRDYFFLLAIASIITTLGIITNNKIVFLGGILMAPLLSPLLALALAIVTGSLIGIGRALKNILYSSIIVILISWSWALIFNISLHNLSQIMSQMKMGIDYLYVAFFSGLAVSYSWVNKTSILTLSGVAMAVSLLPPLCIIGLALAVPSWPIISQSFFFLILNISGIVMAALIIFLFSGLSSFNKEEDKIINQENKGK